MLLAAVASSRVFCFAIVIKAPQSKNVCVMKASVLGVRNAYIVGD